MRCISPIDNGSYHMVTIRTNRTNRQLGEGFLTMQRVRNILSPPNEINFSIRQRVVSTSVQLMRCISPIDNGSYHMVTIRTNRTNRQLGEGFLTMQRVRNILSPPNEINFSIRQRVVSTSVHLVRIDDSKATAQLFLRIVSNQVYWTTLIDAFIDHIW